MAFCFGRVVHRVVTVICSESCNPLKPNPWRLGRLALLLRNPFWN
jgi:hypothetical protein